MTSTRRDPNAAPRAASLVVMLAAVLYAHAAGTVEVDAAAPGFVLPQLQAEAPLNLEQHRGRVILLDFWASWCGPCRESLPEYQKLRDEFAREDFEVIAVNLDENEADARDFLEQHPLQFPLPRDAEGNTAKAYALVGMPTSYLIDRDGVVRSRHSGFKMKDVAPLRVRIQALIAEKHSHAAP